MKLTRIFRTFAIPVLAILTLASPAEAAPTMYFSTAATCTSASATASYSLAAPVVDTTVYLCASAPVSENYCAYSTFLQAAASIENDKFAVSDRTVAGSIFPTDPLAPTYPYLLRNPTTSPDFGSFSATAKSLVGGKLLATFSLTPQAGTSGTYVISTVNSTLELDQPPGNCTTTSSTGTAQGLVEASISLILASPPTSITGTPPAGTVGSSYNHSFTANGSPTPAGPTPNGFTVTTGALPAGLSLSLSGVISGMPTTIGVSNFTVTATNPSGSTSQAFSITVNGTPQTISFTAPANQSFSPVAINALVSTDAATLPVPILTSNSPTICSVSNAAVPRTITMLQGGSAGTPVVCDITATSPASGAFAAAAPVNGTFTITAIAPTAPASASAASGSGQASISFTGPTGTNTGGAPIAVNGYAVTCTGASPPTTTVTGSASPITVTGLLDGNTYSCTVTATNAAGFTSGPSNVATASPVATPVAPTINSAATSGATFTFGVAGSFFDVTALGTPSTFTFSASGLPAWATLNPATGRISGTPTAGGNTAVTLGVSNGTIPNGSQNFTLVVARANQTITFGAQGGQTFSTAGTFAISAGTATSGLAPTYSSLSTGVCTVSGTTVSIVSAGTCNIAADQIGNGNYNPAPQVIQPVVIAKAAQAITFTQPATRSFSPTAIAIAPAAVSNSGLAVTYSSTTPVTCSVSGATVTMFALGACTLQADQPGNTNFNAASPVQATFTIAQAPQSINFNTPPDQPSNAAPFSLTNYATATSGLPVTFASQTPLVCTTTGTNGATLTVQNIGLCTIDASQGGVPNFVPAIERRSFNVVAPGALTMVSSANPVAYGQPVTLTATIGGTAPTGNVTISVITPQATVPICTLPLAPPSQSVSCVASGSYNVTNPVLYSARYDGDANNNANTFTLAQVVNLNRATLSATAYPLQILAGNAVTLRAPIVSSAATRTVTFNENGAPLSGCADVPVQRLPGAGAVTAGIATCRIASISAGTHTYVVTSPNAADGGFEQVILNVTAAASGPADYTDMWWAGTSENGWGMSITQHSAIQFAVFFVYDASGKPTFYAMPGGSFNAAGTEFTGDLYQPTSSPFSMYDAAQFRPGGTSGAAVGRAMIKFASASAATVTYTINGVSGTKSIQRQAFGTDDGLPRLQVNDMWWGGASQNGWGINIAQQGRVLFPVWYTYDSTGNATWFGVPGGTWTGTIFTGDIYTATSSAWLGANYIATNFQPVKVGTLTLEFIDESNAIMTYTVNGVTQAKLITRQPY